MGVVLLLCASGTACDSGTEPRLDPPLVREFGPAVEGFVAPDSPGLFILKFSAAYPTGLRPDSTHFMLRGAVNQEFRRYGGNTEQADFPHVAVRMPREVPATISVHASARSGSFAATLDTTIIVPAAPLARGLVEHTVPRGIPGLFLYLQKRNEVLIYTGGELRAWRLDSYTPGPNLLNSSGRGRDFGGSAYLASFVLSPGEDSLITVVQGGKFLSVLPLLTDAPRTLIAVPDSIGYHTSIIARQVAVAANGKVFVVVNAAPGEAVAEYDVATGDWRMRVDAGPKTRVFSSGDRSRLVFDGVGRFCCAEYDVATDSFIHFQSAIEDRYERVGPMNHDGSLMLTGGGFLDRQMQPVVRGPGTRHSGTSSMALVPDRRLAFGTEYGILITSLSGQIERGMVLGMRPFSLYVAPDVRRTAIAATWDGRLVFAPLQP